MTDTFNPDCPNCQVTIRRIEKWVDHIGCTPKKYQRYEKLLIFVKTLTKKSCCNICECISCDAAELLKEIGEYE